MQEDSATLGVASSFEPIVAVFDSKTMALRTIVELSAAEFDDIWLGVVRGENDAGETIVAREGEPETALYGVLTERGSSDEHARCFDGVLPPGAAVMSLRVDTKFDHAIRIIEVTGGHIEHF